MLTCTLQCEPNYYASRFFGNFDKNFGSTKTFSAWISSYCSISLFQEGPGFLPPLFAKKIEKNWKWGEPNYYASRKFDYFFVEKMVWWGVFSSKSIIPTLMNITDHRQYHWYRFGGVWIHHPYHFFKFAKFPIWSLQISYQGIINHIRYCVVAGYCISNAKICL